ncbi:MAG TPA: hypothetical protein VFR81_00640, partial [Longimicrobium sp.]|nr:hypothetical protein [Longimicrobium sp.]
MILRRPLRSDGTLAGLTAIILPSAVASGNRHGGVSLSQLINIGASRDFHPPNRVGEVRRRIPKSRESESTVPDENLLSPDPALATSPEPAAP